MYNFNKRNPDSLNSSHKLELPVLVTYLSSSRQVYSNSLFKGIVDFDGIIGVPSTRTTSSLNIPVNIVAFSMFPVILLMTNRLSLHNFGRFKNDRWINFQTRLVWRNSRHIQRIWKFNWKIDNIIFINNNVNWLKRSPGNTICIWQLISSTLTFFAAKIVRLESQLWCK